jgi:hypothetical protein
MRHSLVKKRAEISSARISFGNIHRHRCILHKHTDQTPSNLSLFFSLLSFEFKGTAAPVSVLLEVVWLERAKIGDDVQTFLLRL